MSLAFQNHLHEDNKRVNPTRLQQLRIFTQHYTRREKKIFHDHSPDGTKKKTKVKRKLFFTQQHRIDFVT